MNTQRYFTYDNAKQLIAFHAVQSKQNYLALCEITSYLPKGPKAFYKCQFKGWLNYLGICTDEWYRSKDVFR